MAYKWNTGDLNRFIAAMDELDFGGLDRETIEANSLLNAQDVPEEEDPVGCAIATAKMYIDQGVEYF